MTETNQPIRLVTAGNGTHIDPDDIAATYTIEATEPAGAWTDLPEARPRCRMRVTDDDTRVVVIVTRDGSLHYDPKAKLKVDTYPGEKYAEVRAESDARWARYDREAGQ
jgi:hypothetical protein